eukprot:3250066-Amphidinium_carterae.1
MVVEECTKKKVHNAKTTVIVHQVVPLRVIDAEGLRGFMLIECVNIGTRSLPQERVWSVGVEGGQHLLACVTSRAERQPAEGNRWTPQTMTPTLP